jgi:hypothetical protein
MANTIKIKNSGTASNVPSSLEFGELGLNYADGKLYYKNASNNIVQFSAPIVGASSYVAQGRLTGDTSVTANADFVIPFVDDFDPNNWWDATAKKFTPTIAGYYNVTLQVWWSTASVSNNQTNIQIRKNGSTFSISQSPTNTNEGLFQNATKLVYLNGSTDYVEFTAFTGNTTSQTLRWGGSSSGQGTYFSASLVTVGKGDKGDTGEAGPAGSTTLDGLTDVVIDTPLQFQGLMYDGTNWVNSNIPNTYLVRNNTGSTLLKGTLVGAVGAEPSGRIDVAPFEVTGGQDSELRAMGIVASNISNGVNGEVISFGTLTGLDTRGSTASPLAVGDETWAAGDILFAHPTVDGKLTNVRPQHDLAVAFITVRHASSGQIAIRIIPGNNHLEWMHDVSIDSPSSGEVLEYNGSLWVNRNTVRDNMIRFYMEVI